MSELILYHDFASPFSRLGLVVARRVAAEAGLDLRLVPFELFPAPLAVPAAEAAMGEELRASAALAAELEIEMALPALVPRTRKAHEAVAYARERGCDGTPAAGADPHAVPELVMAEALYDAVWRRGLDIGRLDVIVDVGADAGLDRDRLHVDLGLDVREAGVVAADSAAEASGVEGVPTYRLGDGVAVGLYPPAELLHWIEANR